MESDILDTWPKWLILAKIQMTNFKKPVTITEISKEVNERIHSPYFYEVLHLMLDTGAAKIARTEGTKKLLKLDYNKIDELTTESPIGKFIDEWELATKHFVLKA